ncbi:MAG: hypothetical protein S4CHLAM37_17040 [Chlamydiia bacterium]|nr:hypothetical protein [Chlamydiia bacterium]
MVSISTGAPFQAQWTANNSSLKYPEYSGVAYVASKVKRVLLSLPNAIAALCFNPSLTTRKTPGLHSTTSNSKCYYKEVTTPDNVTLFAKIRILNDSTKDTKTAILLNPLGASSIVHDGLATKLLQEGINVVTFNYRGYKDTYRAEDLVLDGESIYQFLVDDLEMNKDSVNFFGYSLGGAIATSVKALHPESKGKLVADRAFKSVYSLLTENLCISRFGRVIKKITSLVMSIFVAYPAYLLGWEFRNDRNITELTSEKLVIYHPNDILVPYSASLASICDDDDVLELNRAVVGGTTHFAPIAHQDSQNGEDPLDFVANFLKA